MLRFFIRIVLMEKTFSYPVQTKSPIRNKIIRDQGSYDVLHATWQMHAAMPAD